MIKHVCKIIVLILVVLSFAHTASAVVYVIVPEDPEIKPTKTVSEGDALEFIVTTPIETDLARLVVTGKEISPLVVRYGSGSLVLESSTNTVLDISAGVYIVSMNNLVKTVWLVAGETVIVETGTLLVSSAAQGIYSVVNYDGIPLNMYRFNDEIELYPGTYRVDLIADAAAIREKAEIAVAERTELKVSILTVTGYGIDSWTLFYASGKKIAELKTGERAALISGDYSVKLNNQTRTVSVQGALVTLKTGAIAVTGIEKQPCYFYEDDTLLGIRPTIPADDIDLLTFDAVELYPEPFSGAYPGVYSLRTEYDIDLLAKDLIELFIGTYTLKLNRSVLSAKVFEDALTVRDSGNLGVDGAGISEYQILEIDDDPDDDDELVSSKTGLSHDLFPDTYRVVMKKVGRDVVLHAREVILLKLGTLKVSSPEEGYYHVCNPDSFQLDIVKVNDPIELFPGTYKIDLVSLKNIITQPVEIGEGEIVDIGSGILTVVGIGKDYWSLFDEEGQQLSILKTNERAAAFIGTCTLTLNGTTQTAVIPDIVPVEVKAGALTVTGTGTDTCFISDASEKQLGSRLTAEPIELFPGTFTATLHTMKRTGVVAEGATTEIPSYSLTVSGEGEAPCLIFLNPDGDPLNSVKLNQIIDLFPETYTLELLSIRQTVSLQADTVVPAGIVTVTAGGTGKAAVYDLTGKPLAEPKFNERLDIFPGTYRVVVNSTEQNAVVGPSQTAELKPGSIRITGDGTDEFYVLNAEDTELGKAKLNQQFFVFSGDFKVRLNNSLLPATVAEGQTAELTPGKIDVSGKGIDEYIVYDNAGLRLVLTKTGQGINLFAGSYRVILNKVRKDVTLTPGQTQQFDTGTLTVSSSEQGVFFVRDTAGNQLDVLEVNQEIELFPGTYDVEFSNLRKQVAVEAGQKTDIATGVLTVTGMGKDEWYLFDASGKQLAAAKTNIRAPVFSGDYTVKLNNLIRTVSVTDGTPAELKSGTILVMGNGNHTYFVYDADGNRLGSRQTGQEIELFDGTYTVVLNNSKETAVVQTENAAKRSLRMTPDGAVTLGDCLAALQVCGGLNPPLPFKIDFNRDGKTGLEDAVYILQILAYQRSPVTVLIAGSIKVTGSGSDDYSIADASGNTLVTVKTGKDVELFAGNYTVKLHQLTRYVTLSAGSKEVFKTGILTVAGYGSDAYSVRTASGDPVADNILTGDEIELFEGAYTVTKDNISKPAAVEADRAVVLSF